MTAKPQHNTPAAEKKPAKTAAVAPLVVEELRPPVELGGPKGPEPTRFGDWERKGRCVDF